MTNEYVERLRRVGLKPHNAVRVVECFFANLTKEELEDLIAKREKNYVAKVQSKSEWA